MTPPAMRVTLPMGSGSSRIVCDRAAVLQVARHRTHGAAQGRGWHKLWCGCVHLLDAQQRVSAAMEVVVRPHALEPHSGLLLLPLLLLGVVVVGCRRLSARALADDLAAHAILHAMNGSGDGSG